MFRRVLIANRGEIALRLVRACRDLGIGSAILFPEADRTTLAVRLADVAIPVAGSEPRQAYLDIARVLDAARRAGADAVHPGYGFLSENADFARACQEAGLVFIGPPPEAIEQLGDKNRAREVMAAAGVPLVPGSSALPDLDTAVAEAARIGYPVLIKAAAGGGGRGMRLAQDERELRRSMPQAESEARAAFGNGSVYLEKYLVRPRHVEIQVAVDGEGRAVHLYERECSVQRRFQKMLEEAPSPLLDPDTRKAMGEAAVRGAQAAGYRNVGTFEFLVDQDKRFYFLEVNTRLQVEHPVTEELLGLDLVQAQVRLAAGEPLPWSQEDLRPRGWALECRIAAEDPEQGFLPALGRVSELRFPAGPGVRVDSHLYAGYEVPPHFDSLIAKVVTFGSDREQARRRMLRALDEFLVGGVRTTLPFHRALLQHPAFVAGDLSTGFLAEHFPSFASQPGQDHEELAALATALELHALGGAVDQDLAAAGEAAARAWRGRSR